MSWSIAEVARMSGVTSRTLRHYDEIGLLPPGWVAGNGYRHYVADDLLRLQQILVLRELGLGLNEIASVLDQQTDQVEALRAHHKRLLAERDRLATLAGTVERTIAELEERKDGSDMPRISKPENLFEGFDPSQYDAEAREVDAHYQGVCRFWTPTATAYKGLGQIYVDDPRFKSAYDKIAPRLAEYQRDAMAAFADARLS